MDEITYSRRGLIFTVTALPDGTAAVKARRADGKGSWSPVMPFRSPASARRFYGLTDEHRTA